ncbi:MAG: hypothetical protein WC515_05550 [Candidatus Omnitrophota bacterium]
MSMNKIACFIAMAFDHPDTDKIYDSILLPMLKSKNIAARRIDRIQHNDDITTRIIEEINSADFCIADLTFARPSVYYEAGYAERGIPVIYIMRKDHFKHKPEDEHGNFRAHFDVQVKNIIPWVSYNDAVFKKKLRKRIEYIMRPIEKMRKEIAVLDNEKLHFASLSLFEKVQYCKTELESYFRKYKFHKFPREREGDRHSTREEKRDAQYLVKGQTGFYSDNLVFWKPSKSILRNIGSHYTYWFGVGSIYKTILEKCRKNITGLIYFSVIVSPNKVLASSIAEALSGYRNAAYKDLKYFFVDVRKEPIEISKNKTVKLKITSLFIVIDNVQSKRDLSLKYNQIFDFVVDQSDRLLSRRY